jgi:hypothetical protein
VRRLTTAAPARAAAPSVGLGRCEPADPPAGLALFLIQAKDRSAILVLASGAQP